MVEESVFTRPAVADLMENGFVEARLHVENQAKRPKPEYERFLELRDKHVGSVAIPAYVVLDPKSGESLAYYVLDGPNPDTWAADFTRIFGALREQ